MAYSFEGETADEAWQKAVSHFRENDLEYNTPSRLGPMAEILHASFIVSNPRQRWVFSKSPAINPAFAIAELIWILAGRDDADFLNFWNPLLPKFAGNDDAYYGAYGARLKASYGFDQIDAAYKALRGTPHSRQIVLQIWHPNLDLPDESGEPRASDIPCNICSMPKIREGRLEWMQVMRSNDLILGSPHNFVHFTSLQEILSGWLEIDIGAYYQINDSLHVYEHDQEKLIESLPLECPKSKDRLDLPKKEFDAMFLELLSAFDELRGDNLKQTRFNKLISQKNFPMGYQNFFVIAAADAARRKNWKDEMMKSTEMCTNPALKNLWEAWRKRREEEAEKRK